MAPCRRLLALCGRCVLPCGDCNAPHVPAAGLQEARGTVTWTAGDTAPTPNVPLKTGHVRTEPYKLTHKPDLLAFRVAFEDVRAQGLFSRGLRQAGDKAEQPLVLLMSGELGDAGEFKLGGEEHSKPSCHQPREPGQTAGVAGPRKAGKGLL